MLISEHWYRNANESSYIRQDITYILSRIRDNLLKGFLSVPLRDDNGTRPATTITVADNAAVNYEDQCPAGSYRTTSGCSKYSAMLLSAEYALV